MGQSEVWEEEEERKGAGRVLRQHDGGRHTHSKVSARVLQHLEEKEGEGGHPKLRKWHEQDPELWGSRVKWERGWWGAAAGDESTKWASWDSRLQWWFGACEVLLRGLGFSSRQRGSRKVDGWEEMDERRWARQRLRDRQMIDEL